MKKPQVSIIVLLWNHFEDVTKPFLDSFKAEGVDYELILFDNGSTDGTAEAMLGKNIENALYVRSDKNLGFAGGNNEALKYAKGDYVLFLNNDVIVHDPKWLSRLLESARNNPKSLVGTEKVESNSMTEVRNRLTSYLNGWCLLIPREFLEKYGGFDENFGLAYFEDVEICARASKLGYSLVEKNVAIQHLQSRSSRDQLLIGEQTKHAQTVFRNSMLALQKGERKRIVFYLSKTYPFTEDDYFGKGVGGAEASLILCAKEFARQGWMVDIYNSTKEEGEFSGVNYFNLKSFNYEDYADVFVLFRNSMLAVESVNSPLKLFWSCDQRTTNDWEVNILPFIDKIIAISPYHRDYLLKNYPINKDEIVVIDLGINVSDYSIPVKKTGKKLLYCSVPRRGLQYLLPIYQRIREHIHDVELYITSDYRLWGAMSGNEEFINMFSGIPGVHFLGKIPREELVMHQKTADVMIYPCDYDENFCISAMECIAAGAIPVTTEIGALPTTVNESGVLIPHHPSLNVYQEIMVDAVISILENTERTESRRMKGRERALTQYSWEYIVQKQWIPMLKLLLMKKMKSLKPHQCLQCGAVFSNSYEMFKHRAQAHEKVSHTPVGSIEDFPVMVVIRTTRSVELSVNDKSWVGKELRIPQEHSGDVVRILTEAYGEGIIDSSRVDRALDKVD